MIGSALTCAHGSLNTNCHLPYTGFPLTWVVLIALTLVVLGATLWRTSHR